MEASLEINHGGGGGGGGERKSRRGKEENGHKGESLSTKTKIKHIVTRRHWGAPGQ